MASVLYKLVFGVGLISLIHTAYSAAQHRSFLHITEQEFSILPFDILFQGLMSFIITMFGMVHITGDFKEIRANIELEKKSWETFQNRPSFYIFNHRGKALSPNYQPPAGKSVLDH